MSWTSKTAFNVQLFDAFTVSSLKDFGYGNIVILFDVQDWMKLSGERVIIFRYHKYIVSRFRINISQMKLQQHYRWYFLFLISNLHFWRRLSLAFQMLCIQFCIPHPFLSCNCLITMLFKYGKCYSFSKDVSGIVISKSGKMEVGFLDAYC